MARVQGVSSRDAGPRVKLVYWFVRRGLAAATGHTSEGSIEPLQVYAHVPGLLRAYAGLEQATSKLHQVPERLRMLAELKAAAMTSCPYCIDLGSEIARRSGMSDEELLALSSYRHSDLFTDRERLVLDYVVGMSSTPAEVSDALFAELRRQFDDAQLVELTHVIALENLRGRFNVAFGIGAPGFSKGSVCAVPASAAGG
jgi:AhpD family alkylhydroperoxidase